jgi:hypothetical protein
VGAAARGCHFGVGSVVVVVGTGAVDGAPVDGAPAAVVAGAPVAVVAAAPSVLPGADRLLHAVAARSSTEINGRRRMAVNGTAGGL